ncbi:hypothetical protein NEOLI_002171 [Neolecta irregularis DAH-3]|uniref:Uncharacterized protein n=1 Tax=Neolecta irregularis (strain DAH-3) TaxID=1198029 RepID=A0A1U7LSM2_NEOID|nr:hypothetical protein NEOLI_002171 [Neolecta irregularis DAH-3]|eukprot:OLL25542.1 hypothetical protein NEOLI_002171 [Neolecta irregularis DAH-3]
MTDVYRSESRRRRNDSGMIIILQSETVSRNILHARGNPELTVLENREIRQSGYRQRDLRHQITDYYEIRHSNALQIVSLDEPRDAPKVLSAIAMSNITAAEG